MLNQKKNTADWKKPFGLALGLILLASFAFWLENKHKPQQEAKKDLDKKVLSLKDLKIKELKIFNPTDNAEQSIQQLSVKCLDFESGLCKVGDQSKWEITAPSKLRADDTNINSLLSAISNLNAAEVLDLSSDTPEKRESLLKDYKLDADSRGNAQKTQKIEVVYSTASAEKSKSETFSRTLYIGDQHPIGENFFALMSDPRPHSELQEKSGNASENINSTRILLIPNYFKSNIQHNLTYWRDKKLFSLNVSQIQEIQTKGQKSQYSAFKKDGKWTLQQGNLQFLGDIENIDNLLSAVFYLNAKSFVHENKNSSTALADLKNFKPIFEMNLKPQSDLNQSPIVFKLFEKQLKSSNPKQPTESKLYATVSNLDPVFEMEISVKDRVEKSIKELRLAKLITTSERFNLKKLTFEGLSIGQNPLTLKEEDGKWYKMEGETKTLVNHDKVQEFLDKISGNRIKDFLTDNQAFKSNAENTPLYMKVTLGELENPEHKVYAFWTSDKKTDQFFSKNLNIKGSESYTVDFAIKDSLPWNPHFFDTIITPSTTPSPLGK